MKKIYIEPKVALLNIDIENSLCAATAVAGHIISDQYEKVVDDPIDQSPGDDNWEPAITAKRNDGIWEDDDF